MTQPRTDSDARMTRGLEVAKRSPITENGDGSFTVPSLTSQGVFYIVKALGEVWTCDCPDFMNRADRIEACKHIFGVRFWIAARVELQSKPKPQVFAEDTIQCDKCGSIRVIRYGKTPTRQTWWCKDCSHKFTPSLTGKTRYTPEMITLTLDLYFSGLSCRKIARTVSDHFGMNLGKSSIYRWIETFVPKVSEYAKTLTPELSETWQADELFVKMKGGETEKQYGQKGIAYLWNVMDRKTRFLIASTLTAHRDVGAADRAFREAKANAHERLPEAVFTDGLKAYRDAVKFGFPDATHVAKAGIKPKPHANNNRAERLNGTLRERVKVQRGWKTMKTPLAEGQRIQYNFVKPHASLEGQTPAERAGVGVQGNKWLALLRAAVVKPYKTAEN